MTTREQKLRELLGELRLHVLGCTADPIGSAQAGAFRYCADELAAILAETVEVSDAMVDRSVEVVLRNCGETLMSVGDLSLVYIREVQSDALKAALKEMP